MLKISPSILASDFSRLGEEAQRMEAAGADMLHVDVMDGHFVKNITLGPPVIRCLRQRTSLPLDVHLMIEQPENLLDDFISAGADGITIHLEATSQAESIIRRLKEAGVKPAVSIKPSTPVEDVFPFLGQVSMVLIMTVEPGFGGQKLIGETLEKVRILRRKCSAQNLQTDIQVDGGITAENVEQAVLAGANVIVAGSAVFHAEDPQKAIADLRSGARCLADRSDSVV